jgi:hypothetical protein
MEYLPKHIHEKYQQFHYYELLNDFTMSVLDKIAKHFSMYTIDLKVGDIICVRFFNESKYGGLATYYTYLDFYVRDDERFNINQETIISKDLIFKNTTIFDNITLQYNRDIKIENILGN